MYNNFIKSIVLLKCVLQFVETLLSACLQCHFGVEIFLLQICHDKLKMRKNIYLSKYLDLLINKVKYNRPSINLFKCGLSTLLRGSASLIMK